MLLGRDKTKKDKYTKDEEDDYTRQETDYNTRYGSGAAGTYATQQGHSRDSIDSSSREHTQGSTLGEKLHGHDRDRGVVGQTGFVDQSAHNTTSSTSGETTHKKTIGDILHGTERNRGIVGDNPYPEGGAPKTDLNQVTGQPFETSTVHGTHTLGTDGHSNLTSATGTTTTTGSTLPGDSTTLGSEHHERNRLHKDPPAGHPASQY